MGVKLKIAAVLSSLFIAGLVVAQSTPPAPAGGAAGGAAGGPALGAAVGGAAVAAPLAIGAAAAAVAAFAARGASSNAGGSSTAQHKKSSKAKGNPDNPGKGDAQGGPFATP